MNSEPYKWEIQWKKESEGKYISPTLRWRREMPSFLVYQLSTHKFDYQ